METTKKVNWEAIFREAIKRSGKTLVEIAELSHTDKSQLSRFMREERGLSITSAEKVAGVIGLELRKIRKGGKR